MTNALQLLGAAGADVDLLRQQIIVQLLREGHWSPEATKKWLTECLRNKVLTTAVRLEVRALCAEKGLGCQCSTTDVQAAVPTAPVAAATAEGASRFDRDFERMELLGRGAFGEVWRARHRVDRKEYAVKVVPFTFSEEKGPFDHPALREAQTWASFDLPGAVRYHSSWLEVQPHGASELSPKTPKALPAPHSETASEEQSVRFGGAEGAAEWSYSSGLGSEAGVVFERSEGGETPSTATGSGGSAPEPVLQVVPAPNQKQPEPRTQRATLYLQTELVRGGTLRDWIDARNAMFAAAGGDGDALPAELDASAAERIFRQCVEAVARLHEQGLVHRDIKPGNILLTEDGGVRLADFGLAIGIAGRRAAAPMVQDGTALGDESREHTRGVGTPSYASPEQWNGTKYDEKVDVYALGMVAAELLFPVQTQMERAQLFQEFRQGELLGAKAMVCTGAEAEAVPLLLSMVKVDPTQRPSAQQLTAYLMGRGCEKQRCTQLHTSQKQQCTVAELEAAASSEVCVAAA